MRAGYGARCGAGAARFSRIASITCAAHHRITATVTAAAAAASNVPVVALTLRPTPTDGYERFSCVIVHYS